MSKFASSAPSSSKKSVPVVNAAGGKAFAQDIKTELVTHFLTSMVSDQAYRSQGQGIARVSQLITDLASSGEALFVAQAVIAAREQLHMRSISHLASAVLGKFAKGESWKRKFYARIVARPDDAVEILSAYIGLFGKPVPNAMKRGLGDAVSRFDEYSLAKYRGGSGKLKLIDAVNIIHPQATPALKKLMTGTLESADTWEVGLSDAGADSVLKADVWKRLVAENKLGYMAALRNLRNIHNQAPDVLPAVLEMISDPARVAKSKQLPFRFWSAMKVARTEKLPSSVIVALDRALTASCVNVPKLGGRTVVAVDCSGSMSTGISGGRSTVLCSEVAKLLGVLLAQTNDALLVCFADRAAAFTVHPTDSVMGQIDRLAQDSRGIGGGTNFGSIFASLSKAYDRIIILSDNESWGHTGRELGAYQARTGANPYIYLCQLATTGSIVFNPGNPRLFQVAGFSDRIFDLIAAAEVGVNTLVQHVSSIEI